MIGFPDHRQQSTPPRLPAWLNRYTTLGLYRLLVGIVLCLVAFLTNPVPDPSFSWATLSESVRLPIAQPRIEHWPVTYTIGIWLWVFCFPELFFAGYRRCDDRNRGAAVWPVGLPTRRCWAGPRTAGSSGRNSIHRTGRPGLHVRVLAVLFNLRRALEQHGIHNCAIRHRHDAPRRATTG